MRRPCSLAGSSFRTFAWRCSLEVVRLMQVPNVRGQPVFRLRTLRTSSSALTCCMNRGREQMALAHHSNEHGFDSDVCAL